jgi:hypothetical protein
MSVHQTRAFFMERDGFIVDNPNVGPTLAKSYWEFGNSRPFLDLVKEFTGKELSGDAWVAELSQSVDELLASERKDYEKSIAETSNESSCENIDLNMVVRFVDGDKLISDSSKSKGGIMGACREFESFVQERVNN